MSDLNKQQAQQRVNDIQAFRRELERLKTSAGLTLTLDQDQRIDACHRRLLDRYSNEFDIDQDHRDSQLSWGMRLVSLLGALALAASVFFLFYRIWGHCNEIVQTTLLISGAVLTLLLTAGLSRRDRRGYFTRLAALLAYSCFVLNIIVLGQIFNITPSPHAWLLWGIYGVLLAYGVHGRLLLGIGLLCLMAYGVLLFGPFTGSYWMYAWERPENLFVPAIFVFILVRWTARDQLADFASIHRLTASAAFFIALLIMANWGKSSYLPFQAERVEIGYQISGFILAAGAVWLGIRHNWSETVYIGLAAFIAFLYVKFFDWWWASLPKYLFFLILGLSAILILLGLNALRQHRRGRP